MNDEIVYGANNKRDYNGAMMDRGKAGEAIVFDWLLHGLSDYVVSVTDVRRNKVMQELDIDCIITFQGGEVVLAEIKTDRHLGVTPNVLFEDRRINHFCDTEHAAYLGWSWRSKAQWFIFYAESIGKVYTCKSKNFRVACQRYLADAKGKPATLTIPTDEGKTTFNILIPFKPYCEPVFKIFDLEKAA